MLVGLTSWVIFDGVTENAGLEKAASDDMGNKRGSYVIFYVFFI